MIVKGYIYTFSMTGGYGKLGHYSIDENENWFPGQAVMLNESALGIYLRY